VSNGIKPDNIKIDFDNMLFLPVEDQYVLVDIDAAPPVMKFTLQ